MNRKDEYEFRLNEAEGILDEALEKALDCFPEDEVDDARIQLAKFVLKQLGLEECRSS